MSDLAFVTVMVGMILLVPMFCGAVMLAFIRGYQMGHLEASRGLPNAFPWPPLPARAKNVRSAK